MPVVRNRERFIVERIEDRGHEPRRLGVDQFSIVASAACTEPEDVGRPIRGIMLALMLGLASWVAIAVIVVAAIAAF